MVAAMAETQEELAAVEATQGEGVRSPRRALVAGEAAARAAAVLTGEGSAAA